MQLAAGGRARLAAEQPHHGPMFEYTGVPYEGISLIMISQLAKLIWSNPAREGPRNWINEAQTCCPAPTDKVVQ